MRNPKNSVTVEAFRRGRARAHTRTHTHKHRTAPNTYQLPYTQTGGQLLTVLLPRFFTRQLRQAVLPTSPVRLLGTEVSKCGPVPGVGSSCRKSVRNRRDPIVPAEQKSRWLNLPACSALREGGQALGCFDRRSRTYLYLEPTFHINLGAIVV